MYIYMRVFLQVLPHSEKEEGIDWHPGLLDNSPQYFVCFYQSKVGFWFHLLYCTTLQCIVLYSTVLEYLYCILIRSSKTTVLRVSVCVCVCP